MANNKVKAAKVLAASIALSMAITSGPVFAYDNNNNKGKGPKDKSYKVKEIKVDKSWKKDKIKIKGKDIKIKLDDLDLSNYLNLEDRYEEVDEYENSQDTLDEVIDNEDVESELNTDDTVVDNDEEERVIMNRQIQNRLRVIRNIGSKKGANHPGLMNQVRKLIELVLVADTRNEQPQEDQEEATEDIVKETISDEETVTSEDKENDETIEELDDEENNEETDVENEEELSDEEIEEAKLQAVTEQITIEIKLFQQRIMTLIKRLFGDHGEENSNSYKIEEHIETTIID